MANEIVKMVAQKAKISEPLAQIAVDTVVTMLKAKLPPAVGSTLDSFLSSKGSSSKSKGANPLDNLGGLVGGLLGGKK